jgi:cytochrome c biogenesis protein CcmG/thiol:disulfide interchange protein DsbE
VIPEQGSGFSSALRRKGLLGLVVLLIGVGLIFGLFVVIQSPQQPVAPAAPRVPGAGATATSLPTPALPTARPSATESSEKVTIMRFTPTPGAPANASPADGDPVAQVNGRPLDRRALHTLAAADRAMAQLLGQPMPDGRDVLERLVNGELVWQAAQSAQYTAPEGQVAAALDAILAGQRKSQADLAASLAAQGLTFEVFQTYFGRLVTVDQFAQRQAQARGGTVAAYVAQLQARAQISFGPAAQAAANAAVANAISPTPRPTAVATARPVAVSPTPTASTGGVRGVAPGQLAPDFSAAVVISFVTNSTYTNNVPVRLADLSGKPAVLSFWTTWCPYCARQTPVLVEAHRRYGPQGIQFVGIDVKEERPVVEAYVQANGIPYPIGLDPEGQIAAAYQVSGFPTTYFLDAAGRVAAKHVGQLSPEQVDGYLSMLLPR